MSRFNFDQMAVESEGRKAANNNVGYDYNPYVRGTLAYLWWSKGHNKQRAENLR